MQKSSKPAKEIGLLFQGKGLRPRNGSCRFHRVEGRGREKGCTFKERLSFDSIGLLILPFPSLIFNRVSLNWVVMWTLVCTYDSYRKSFCWYLYVKERFNM